MVVRVTKDVHSALFLSNAQGRFREHALVTFLIVAGLGWDEHRAISIGLIPAKRVNTVDRERYARPAECIRGLIER